MVDAREKPDAHPRNIVAALVVGNAVTPLDPVQSWGRRSAHHIFSTKLI